MRQASPGAAGLEDAEARWDRGAARHSGNTCPADSSSSHTDIKLGRVRCRAQLRFGGQQLHRKACGVPEGIRGDRTPGLLLAHHESAAGLEIALRRLKKAGVSCTWQRVDAEPEYRRALRDFKPDLILSDFALPHFDGFSALKTAAADAPDVPFIFFSGTLGEERAIQALKSGAIDYVLKSNPERLVPAVTRALEDAIARGARRNAEARVLRLTRITQMLSAVNAAVVRIRSRTELLTEACRIAHS